LRTRNRELLRRNREFLARIRQNFWNGMLPRLEGSRRAKAAKPSREGPLRPLAGVELRDGDPGKPTASVRSPAARRGWSPFDGGLRRGNRSDSRREQSSESVAAGRTHRCVKPVVVQRCRKNCLRHTNASWLVRSFPERARAACLDIADLRDGCRKPLSRTSTRHGPTRPNSHPNEVARERRENAWA
jgi:hypothetical protein